MRSTLYFAILATLFLGCACAPSQVADASVKEHANKGDRFARSLGVSPAIALGSSSLNGLGLNGLAQIGLSSLPVASLLPLSSLSSLSALSSLSPLSSVSPVATQLATLSVLPNRIGWGGLNNGLIGGNVIGTGLANVPIIRPGLSAW